jgi:hypothetical protein
MTVEYRYVYITPDPYLGERLLMAVVYRGNGVLGAITFDHPAVPCYGKAFTHLYRDIVQRIDREHPFTEAEGGFGPHVRFDRPLRAMSSAWVKGDGPDSEIAWLHDVLATHPAVTTDEE